MPESYNVSRSFFMNWMKKLKGSDMIKKKIIKISEISEFSILPYTQDQKFGNLGKFSFNSNFDSLKSKRIRYFAQEEKN